MLVVNADDSIKMLLPHQEVVNLIKKAADLIKKSPQLAALSFTIAKVRHFSEKHLTNFADY